MIKNSYRFNQVYILTIIYIKFRIIKAYKGKFVNFYMILKINNGFYTEYVKIKILNKDSMETILKSLKKLLFLYQKINSLMFYMIMYTINSISNIKNYLYIIV